MEAKEAKSELASLSSLDKKMDTASEKDLQELEIEKLQRQISKLTTLSTNENDKDKKDKKKKKKQEKKPSVSVIQLFRFSTTRDRFMICFALIGSAFSGAILPVSIIIFGDFLRNLAGALMNPSTLLDETRPLILTLVYLGTAVLVASYFANSFWIMTGENQTRRIRMLYLHAVLRQDMSWFDKAEEGSLTTRLAADTQAIQDGISEKFGMMILCCAQFLSGYIVAFVKGWKMALVMLATMPLLLGTGITMGIMIRKYTLKVQNSYADAGSVAEQVFAGLRTVYSFSLQERFAQRFEKELVKARLMGIKRGAVLGVGFGSFMSILFMTYGLAFWFGSRLVKTGEFDGPNVLVVFMGMMMGSMALLQTPPNLAALSTAMGAAHKIYSTIDRVPEIDPDSDEGLTPDSVHGDIEFKNVKFKYPTRPDLMILKDLSIKIHPGMTVAFVGASGSGKSTAIQLLQRFYDPISGEVLLDGQDLKSYNVRWLRQHIGVVGQEPVLFNMSIRQNLLMGVTNPEKITQDDIIEACKKANCHTFISQLPQGYNTLVGEHGGMLSGGQKQRVAIARAILKNPTILLLDEATSALDTQSERLVQHALDAAAENRTTIVIAHRLSTIRNADLIVVMQQGELIEQGNHQQLIERGGVYAGLVAKQQIATKKDDINGDGDSTEHDTEKLLEQEKEEIQQNTDDLYMDEKQDNELRAQVSKDDRRISMASSIDAYELKLKRQKQTQKNVKKQKAPVFKVLRMMRPEWHLMAMGCCGAALAGAVFPCFAFSFSQVIVYLTDPTKKDEIDSGPVQGTNLFAFLFVMIGIAAFIGFSVQTIAFELAGERFTERLRALIFRAYMRQEVGYYDEDENSMGALTTKLAIDAKNVNELVTKVWGDFLQVFFTACAGLGIAFAYSWLLTLIILCVTPLIVIAAGSESRVQRGFEDNTKKANAQSGEVAGEAIKEIRTIAALNKQSHFEAKYFRATERPHKLATRKALLASIGHALFRGLNMYTNAIAFYAGVRLIMDDRVEFQNMFTSMMAIMITATNVGRGSVFTATYAKAKFSAISTFEVLERQPRIDPDLEGIEPSSIKGDIDFENITFAYPARAEYPVFQGEFGFKGKANQSIALVGPSGCGKSTTIGMLLRWYDPQGGVVRLDEHAVNTYTLSNLRSHISWVGQEPVLFDLSIGDNIRFGLENAQATQEQIEEACRAANIHQFVASLPQGYDTRVGDKGSQLSGGQKQRIAIARAWIRKPKVLLLDEATSALDSESEKLVQAALDKVLLEGGRTTITIAHRLSTIQVWFNYTNGYIYIFYLWYQ
ncbi:putative ABC transporter protein [Phascolomyces articulosus]|uniref:ABC transporter protein n=1 Tax=Phascolomyces articulosus TaxID=60185 RepID=A0AAD5KAG1_9FUNG|nr:putative ABC transporter protein [Phascolomyces articulosus]